MPRDESIKIALGPKKPERINDEILPSVDTLFDAKNIFLFCEGKTEYNYFTGFKDDVKNSRLKIVPRFPNQENREGNDVLKLTEQVVASFNDGKVTVDIDGTKKSFDIEDLDEIKILFDCDTNFDLDRKDDTKYSRARDIRLPRNVDYYISNYSIEVWILCHFMKPLRRMKLTGLKRNIRQQTGWPRYKKNDPEIYNKVKDRIDDAKRNAQLLIDEKRQQGIALHSEGSNPVTEIGLLIEIIEAMII